MSTIKGNARVGTPFASPPERTRAATASDKPMTDAARVGREFEAIFVRTMLRSTPLGQKSDAYTDMGVEALAKSVTAGRGLGLGDRIRDALEASDKARKSHAMPAQAGSTTRPAPLSAETFVTDPSSSSESSRSDP
jgi:Rod binding domain-containing protein